MCKSIQSVEHVILICHQPSLLNPGTINITQTADTLQAYPSGYTYQWLDCTTNLPIVGATDSIFVSFC
ncbi:MAG: hypothetical protein IPN14_14430 [Bacteroidetes bacterium]|nr:hypothetical protein [Bacteroidota bacterium]